MTPLVSFLWGFGGSLAVEVAAVNQLWQNDPAGMPARYKNPWFWFCRLLLAVTGGGLTLAYGIKDNPVLAANIGASAPLILQTLARGVSTKLERLPGARFKVRQRRPQRFGSSRLFWTTCHALARSGRAITRPKRKIKVF
jgi:hypothetical protein